MSEEIKDVMKGIEEVIAKTITFNGLINLFERLRMFVEYTLYDSFDEYLNENVEDFEDDDLYQDATNLLSKLREINTDEVFKTVQFSGGEGEGDHWEHVIQHVESERFMHCEGYYASYQGFDTDSAEYIEVKAVPITVIDYQAI